MRNEGQRAFQGSYRLCILLFFKAKSSHIVDDWYPQ